MQISRDGHAETGDTATEKKLRSTDGVEARQREEYDSPEHASCLEQDLPGDAREYIHTVQEEISAPAPEQEIAVAEAANGGERQEQKQPVHLRSNVRVTGDRGKVRRERSDRADALGRPCRLACYTDASRKARNTLLMRVW